MLKEVDNLILRLLDTGWTTAPPPAKPGFFFTIPDEDWRTKVKADTNLRLNIYLYEVRENRELRRAAWDNSVLPDRSVVLSQPPAYLDCYYLITAWSPSDDTPMTSPTLDEHQVLSEALRILFRNPDVVPAAVGVVGGGQVFQEAHVYLTVAPPQPPPVLQDFWGTMKLPWRPAVLLTVTAPLDVLKDSAPPAPVVTKLIQRYTVIGGTAVEEWIEIGGLVLRAADQSPIAGATVTHVASGETATTDAQGRYIFGVRRGVHKFRAAAAGMTPAERDIDVPAGLPATHIFQLAP